jgi:hypothetical protein
LKAPALLVILSDPPNTVRDSVPEGTEGRVGGGAARRAAVRLPGVVLGGLPHRHKIHFCSIQRMAPDIIQRRLDSSMNPMLERRFTNAVSDSSPGQLIAMHSTPLRLIRTREIRLLWDGDQISMAPVEFRSRYAFNWPRSKAFFIRQQCEDSGRRAHRSPPR